MAAFECMYTHIIHNELSKQAAKKVTHCLGAVLQALHHTPGRPSHATSR